MYPRIRTLGGTATLACLLYAGSAATTATAQDAHQHAAPSSANPDPNRAVKSPGNAEWAKTAEEARARAAAENKLVYYEFDSPNCGDCHRMQSLLYPAFDFEAL